MFLRIARSTGSGRLSVLFESFRFR